MYLFPSQTLVRSVKLQVIVQWCCQTSEQLKLNGAQTHLQYNLSFELVQGLCVRVCFCVSLCQTDQQ